MGIRHLAKQDARWRHQLLKSQGTANEQAREAKLGEHHPVEQAHKDDCQTADTTLKQAEPQQTGKWKRQL